MNKIDKKLQKIRNFINISSNTRKNDIDIIAVTKNFDKEHVVNALGSGITSFGENRVQESEKKFSYFPGFEKIKKRFIGHLQTNKVNKCLNIFDTVDSLDSLKL